MWIPDLWRDQWMDCVQFGSILYFGHFVSSVLVLFVCRGAITRFILNWPLLNLCVPVHVAIASPRSKLGTHHFLVHASWGQDRSCLRYAAAWLGNIGIVTPQKKGGQRGPLNFRVGSNPKGFTFYNCITHIATSYRHTPCTRSTRYMRVRVGAWNNSTLGYQHSCRSFRIFDFRPVWTLWSGG